MNWSIVFRRLIRILHSLKFIKRLHPVTYTGEISSTNDIYQSRHWGVRSKLEMDFTKIFRRLLDEDKKTPSANEYGLVVFYNNAMDVDNLTFMAKVFVDAYRREIKTFKLKDPKTKKVTKEWKEIVYEGYTPNDDQRYYKFLALCPDKGLPKSTVEFNLCVL